MLKSKSSRWLAGPYLVWMAIFTVVPLFIVIWYAMTNADGQFTFDNLTQIGRYSSVFARSLILAAISTVAWSWRFRWGIFSPACAPTSSTLC